jgi:hypothetical protein
MDFALFPEVVFLLEKEGICIILPVDRFFGVNDILYFV